MEAGAMSPAEVGTAGIVGTGSVGASWTALYLAAGLSVVATDTAAGAEERARSFVAEAWPALRRLGLAHEPAPPQDRLRFVATAAMAAAAADFVQENVLEVPEVKGRVLAEIDAALPAGRVIGSSTGGIPPSALQAHCAHPERLVVIHPFNPAHLVPLVEVVGGAATAPEVVDWAMAFARRLGKHPIRVRREAPGHMVNRLQFALLREAVHCLVEGIASAEDIDAAVSQGLGPRWALMGSLGILTLAGGPGGMAGILDHTGAAIDGWWQALGQPRLTPAVRHRLVAAADEIAGGRSLAELIRWRDDKLVDLLAVVHERENHE